MKINNIKASTKTKATLMSLAHRKFKQLKATFKLLACDLSKLWASVLAWAWAKMKDVRSAGLLMNQIHRLLSRLGSSMADLNPPRVDLTGWRLSPRVNVVLDAYNAHLLTTEQLLIKLYNLQSLSLNNIK